MARKERAEVSIFPREPARASPRRKIRPRERRGSQAGEERTLSAFGQSQKREGDKHRGGQAPQQEQRYQTRALAALGPGRLFLAHIKHALSLCVCNPMRGDMAMLPPLAGTDKPGDYACALYTGHDLGTPRPMSSFFRLFIVYNRRSFTALRSYSPDTGRWSTEAKRSWGAKIACIRDLCQSIVVGGVAYWLLGRSAFAVRVALQESPASPSA
jgi:hypothetical protein